MATPNPLNMALVAEVLKSCACGRRFNLAEWQTLPGGTRAIQGGELYEVRHCACRSTLYVPLEADPKVSALMAKVEHLQHELEAAQRHGAQVEAELERKSKVLRTIQRKTRAANQAPPNPPGSVVVVSLDPSDPGFTTLRKASGGAR